MTITEMLEQIEPRLLTLSESDRAVVEPILDCARVGEFRAITDNELEVLHRLARSVPGVYADVSPDGYVTSITVVSNGSHPPCGEPA